MPASASCRKGRRCTQQIPFRVAGLITEPRLQTSAVTRNAFEVVPMISVRPAAERGHFDHGWLDTWHSFSFSDYYDPAHMGYSTLRVINEDRVAPGRGFPTHGHQDMEILTYILSGSLEHKDSLGNGSVIRPGDVQRMSAGTGVRHSEFNPSPDTPVHLLQIWLLPNRKGVAPGYAQRHFSEQERRGRLCLLMSPDGRDGSIDSHQDALIYAALLDSDQTAGLDLATGRRAYVQVARGAVSINGQDLDVGDGLRVEGEPSLKIVARRPSEVLVFDLPG
jgi:redox-sensitive bicupin YhaK (pirin superfamily)